MVLQRLCPERVWSPTGFNMNPKGHNRLLRTNEAWFHKKKLSYDVELHGTYVSHGGLQGMHASHGSMGYVYPMEISLGYMYPMNVHGIHVPHGYPWETIPWNTRSGQVGMTSQEPSRGRCWVSLKGPLGSKTAHHPYKK